MDHKPGPKRGYKQSESHKAARGMALKKAFAEGRHTGGFKKGHNILGFKGKNHRKETINIMSVAHQGDKNPVWNGGSSFLPYCEKFNPEFKERVRAFFNYQCTECGTPQNGYKLHIHHVNFNKESCCDSTIPIFVSLCRSCHGKTQRNRHYWERHFTEMINGYYGGKCYFTKEEACLSN